VFRTPDSCATRHSSSNHSALVVSAFAWALVMAGSAARAQPSVPWMPDAATRHDIELLVDEAGLDLLTTQWPLPIAAVARALDKLPDTLAPALGKAREHVRRALQAQAQSRVGLTVRGRAEALSGFGDEATPGPLLDARSHVLDLPRLAAQVGGRLEDRSSGPHGAQLRLNDSVVATEVFGIQLQAWSHRSWWGPGWQNSLILGNNAPSVNALGIQRREASTSATPWLSWMGPWNAELFVARTEDAMHAYLLGQRFTLRPFSHVEIGLTRTAQWGGEGRPESLESFIRLIGGGSFNAETPQQQSSDPGNAMAGFDLRARCPGSWRCAVYAQLIGEDEAGLMPSKYLGLYGLEHWSADGQQRMFAEYIESQCGAGMLGSPEKGCAYRNWAYPEGYASDGRWVGANVGPDSKVLTLGWMNVASASALRLHIGHIGSRAGTFSPTTGDPSTSGRLLGLSARQGVAWGGSELIGQFDWMRVAAPSGPRIALRLGLQWQFP